MKDIFMLRVILAFLSLLVYSASQYGMYYFLIITQLENKSIFIFYFVLIIILELFHIFYSI